MTITIEEFLEARLLDAEKALAHASGSEWFTLRPLVDSLREVLEFHKDWPVLVETKPELTSFADYDVSGFVNGQVFQMSQQIAWMTQEEYRKKFGSEPPTAPMLRKWAQHYWRHKDFQEEWKV